MAEYISPIQEPYPPPVSQPFISGSHFGVDLAVPPGTPVVAIADGTVVLVADQPTGAGLHTNVDHAGGVQSRDFHLSAFEVTVGESVTQGQVLGLSGNTGQSTGPHLHHEHRIGGVAVDPAPYLNQQTSPPEEDDVAPTVIFYNVSDGAQWARIDEVWREGHDQVLDSGGTAVPPFFATIPRADLDRALAAVGVAPVPPVPGGATEVLVKVTAEVIPHA